MASQTKHTRENFPKILVYTNNLIFLKELSRWQKLHFPLKSIWTDIFDWVWRNIFCWLFFRCLFFLGQGENTSVKNPAETQSMKIQVKSCKIPVRKNVVKTMQSQYSKFNHSNKGKDLKILNNSFNRYSGQVASRTSEKNISTIWIVEKFDIA